MASDNRALDEAWGHIPHTVASTVGVGTFTRARVERNLSIVSGVGALGLGLQSFFTALGTDDGSAMHLSLMLLTFVPLGIMTLACFVGRFVRVTAAAFTICYLIALTLWPVATAGTSVSGGEPWLWYLVSISTLAAALAFPLPVQIASAIITPLLFGVVRYLQVEHSESAVVLLAFDVSFALILNGVILSLGWVFRSAAANVDRSRALAVESYAKAAAADATEQERVAVAALMHDSVLAALIAAERADTPRERTLAVGMAREALTRLANTEQDAGEGSDEPTDAAAIADSIERVAADLGVTLVVQRTIDGDASPISGRVARALVLAGTQAIANAVEHADAQELTVAVNASGRPTRVRIVVRDRGGGFSMEEVGDDRLGIRGSIVARMAAVGGSARIDADHVGTTVQLDWQEGGA